jgi:hypothetical protein
MNRVHLRIERLLSHFEQYSSINNKMGFPLTVLIRFSAIITGFVSRNLTKGCIKTDL